MPIGLNGPVPLEPGTYDFEDLKVRLRAALDGDDAGRTARVRGALRAAKFYASQIPVLRILTLSATSLKVGEAITIYIGEVLNGVVLTGAPPPGMTLNSVARTVSGTPLQSGSFSLVLKQTLDGAVGSPAEQVFDLAIADSGTGGGTGPAPVTLQTISLSDAIRVGVPSTGSILGSTSGSTISETVSGLTVDSTARSYTWDGSGVAGSVTNALIETHPNATNSGRASPITIQPAIVTKITINGSQPTTGQVGVYYTSTVQTANGSGPKVFSRSGDALLPGLSFSATTGLTTGTPTQAGTMSNQVVTVADDTGTASTSPTTVTIAAATVTPTLGTPALSGTLRQGTASSGTISGLTSGSALTTDVSGLSFDRNAQTYSFTGAAPASTGYSITETLAGATGSPKATAIAVQSATPALGALSLSGTLRNGTPSSGSINGATIGSGLVSNVSGLTINSGARSYTFDGSGAAGTTGNGLVETLAGATGSPRSSPVTIVSGSTPSNQVTAGGETITVGGQPVTAGAY